MKHLCGLHLTLLFLLSSLAQSQSTVVLTASSQSTVMVVCTSNTVILQAVANYSSPVIGFTWTGSSFPIPIFQNSITVGAGSYSVVANMQDGTLLGPGRVLVGPCTGMVDTVFNQTPKMLFDPLTGGLRFKDLERSQLVTITINDLSGRRRFSYTDIDPTTEINIAPLEPGIYLVVLSDCEKVIHFRALKW